MQLASRTDLFRLLGDEDRLRILALCAEEELTIGELAKLLGESQPQITKKSQPLRDAGLVVVRRDGQRTLLKSAAKSIDAVVDAALAEGRALCVKDGSLARVAAVVAQREDSSRRFFQESADAHAMNTDAGTRDHESLALLPIIGALLPARRVVVDVGTGAGLLLPILSPLFDRVIAVDRSDKRLAQAAVRVREHALPNVRLRQAELDDARLMEEVDDAGGADVVVLLRVLHHAARPAEVLKNAARLLAPHGVVVVVDYAPHDDESFRERGHVWLGFSPERIQSFCKEAGLTSTTPAPLSLSLPSTAHDKHLPFFISIARKSSSLVH